jgi:hypothetical protein
MLGDTKQANSATTAVTFITIGSLISVWSTVYYFYIIRHEASDLAYLWCSGFFFSGLVLIGIGIGLGRIARVVRHAEVTTAGPGPTAVPAVTVAAPTSAPIAANQVAQAPPATAIPVTTAPQRLN